MSDDLISRSALLEKMKQTSRYFNIKFDIEEAPAVDAVPVDEIKLLSITIDKATGIPETTLQIGERRFVLRTDPVDAVEVVRCKDCKHWEYEYDDVGLCVTDVPDIDGVERVADDFCSYGERRDNATD